MYDCTLYASSKDVVTMLWKSMLHNDVFPEPEDGPYRRNESKTALRTVDEKKADRQYFFCGTHRS